MPLYISAPIDDILSPNILISALPWNRHIGYWHLLPIRDPANRVCSLVWHKRMNQGLEARHLIWALKRNPKVNAITAHTQRMCL